MPTHQQDRAINNEDELPEFLQELESELAVTNEQHTQAGPNTDSHV